MKSVIQFSMIIALSVGSSLASASAASQGYSAGEAPCPFKAARDAQKRSQAIMLARADQILGKSNTAAKLQMKLNGRIVR